MSELSDWIQSYWYELSSVVLQCAILVTLIWYARKASRARAASREEEVEAVDRPVLTPGGFTLTAQAYAQKRGSSVVASCRRVVRWLQSPVGS